MVIDDRVMLDDEDIHINVVFQQSTIKREKSYYYKQSKQKKFTCR